MVTSPGNIPDSSFTTTASICLSLFAFLILPVNFIKGPLRISTISPDVKDCSSSIASPFKNPGNDAEALPILFSKQLLHPLHRIRRRKAQLLHHHLNRRGG